MWALIMHGAIPLVAEFAGKLGLYKWASVFQEHLYPTGAAIFGGFEMNALYYEES